MDDRSLDRAASLLAGARNGFALTGAGISVESGIPDFRSEDGLWTRYPIERYGTIDALRRDPDAVWEFFRAMEGLLRAAAPSPAHRALADMEQFGFLRGVVTQNVDGLHARAGSRNVVCLHGSSAGLHCPACGHTEADAASAPPGDPPPLPPTGHLTCPRCAHPLKPPVVLFGESLPSQAIARAMEWAAEADFVLVVGTSLTVWPAAGIPSVAAQRGAALVEVNLEPGALRGWGGGGIGPGARSGTRRSTTPESRPESRPEILEIGGAAGEALPALLERATAIRDRSC